MRFPLAAIFVCLLLRAQDFHGNLIGSVNDSSGGRIPSASITLEAANSSFHRSATSDHRGEFRFSDLTPGTYSLTVTAPGFADARADVTVTVSSSREISVTLNPAPSQQRIDVA